MPDHPNLYLVIAALLFLICLGDVALATDNHGQGGTVEHRVLHFPEHTSLGTLRLTSRTAFSHLAATPTVNAIGVVKLDVPAGYLVYLDLTGKIFQNPALLDTICNQQIESLHVGFLSMDESEVGTSDRILARVPQMRDLEELVADRSDSTDKGLSCIKNMPKLRVVSMFNCEARGSCLKQIATCPNLTQLHFWDCRVDQNNLKYLPAFKKLEVLNLGGTNLTDDGVKLIANCSGLKNVRLSDNPIDDRCALDLRRLTKMYALDVGETKITISGIRLLKGLPLRLLNLPATVSVAHDAEIVKLFPGVTITRPKPKRMSKEDMDMFAPLH